MRCRLGVCYCGWPDRCQRRIRRYLNLPEEDWEAQMGLPF